MLTGGLLSGAAQGQAVHAAQICKAVVAAMNGHGPEIISAASKAGETILRYTRPADGKRWAYRCVVRERRVFVTLADQDINYENDNVIREFDLDSNRQRLKVTETFKGEEGSPIETWFKLSDLGP